MSDRLLAMIFFSLKNFLIQDWKQPVYGGGKSLVNPLPQNKYKTE